MCKALPVWLLCALLWRPAAAQEPAAATDSSPDSDEAQLPAIDTALRQGLWN